MQEQERRRVEIKQVGPLKVPDPGDRLKRPRVVQIDPQGAPKAPRLNIIKLLEI